MADITPKLNLPSSAEVPGGIANSSSSSDMSISMGTMVSPKKSDTVGGMQVGATTLTQGSGNDVFIISTLGIHLGNANFEDAPFSVDMQGNMNATSGHFSGDITGSTGTFSGTITGGSLNIPDTTSANSFHVDANGNTWWGATVIGSATAKILNTGIATFSNAAIEGGSVAGWTITSTALSFGTGANTVGIDAGGVNPAFYAGSATPASAPFRVTSAGALTATSATITGAITATSGTIGSFTIGTYLYTGTKTAYDDANAGVHLGSDGIGIGNNVFTVSSAGALVATSATITGSITATSGSIGGWTVAADRLSYGTDADYIGLIPGTGIQLGDSVFADAPFSVTNAGVLKAVSGTIGGNILAPTSIGSTTFVSGPLGTGWNISNTGTAEFQDITARGIIRTSVFEKDTISAVNGMVLISSADVLDADMTALDASTLTIKGETTFVANEVIRIKDGTDDEWMLVTNAASAPTYTVTRDLASSYTANTNPIWKKGTAVVSMGVGTGAKTGFILLDSSSSYSPYIDIYGRNSNTYSDYTLHGRFGWLKGITDADVGLATTDVWGLYTDNAYIKGVIVANTGYIGGTTGWIIASGKITSTGIGLATATGDATYAFWAGNDTPASAEFSVSHAGALVATSATITGAITATSGTIGSFTIGTYLYTGSKTAYNDTNAGVHLGSDGIGIGNNVFTVNGSTGALVATSATITGAVNATSGKFGTATNYWSVGATGLTAVSASTDVIINYGKTDFTNTDTGFILGYDYSATLPKFYIGTATQYLNFDGANVVLTGTINNALISKTFTAGMAITAGNAVYVSDGTSDEKLAVTGAGSSAVSDNIQFSGSIRAKAQSFQTSVDTYIGAVSLDVNFSGGGTMQLDLQADSAGVPSGTSLMGGAEAYTSAVGGGIYRFNSQYKCVAGTTYWITMTSSANDFSIMCGQGYANGKAMNYDGANWADATPATKEDIDFDVYEILPLGYIGKAEADVDGRYQNFVGFASESIAISASGKVSISGIITGLSGLTPSQYYLSDTAGAISTSAGSNTRKVGIAISTTELLITNTW